MYLENYGGISVKNLILGYVALTFLFLLSPVTQAEAQAEDKQKAIELEDIAIIGSRLQVGRSVVESAVPIDIIKSDELLSYGGGDMNSQLSRVIPSYNVNEQPISDAATFIRPANLRGLPSDNTLVLINGKRRHRGAVITINGGGISDGAHGSDISTIPAIAVKQVEVLRDGASAQYGSDAIAGVLNFQLKDASEGGSINVRMGQYYKGDGESLNVAGNIGLPLTDAGFANFSFEYRQANATNRSVQRTNAQGLIDAGNTNVRDPAQIWGSAKVNDDYKLFANTGLTINDNIKLYAFGNYAKRKVKNGFFFRSPGGEDTSSSEENSVKYSPRKGVFSNGDRSSYLPAINVDGKDFRFQDRFPGGFTPQFSGRLKDHSVAGGFKGKIAGGWHYDVSAVYGRSGIDLMLQDTINPQLVTLFQRNMS